MEGSSEDDLEDIDANAGGKDSLISEPDGAGC